MLTQVLFCAYSRLTQDPKSGNWRVYLNDGELCQPVPVASQQSGRGDRCSTLDSNGSMGHLSSVLKKKTQVYTRKPSHQGYDMAVIITSDVK